MSTMDEIEIRRLRELLNNAWLVVNDPANAFLVADRWSQAVEAELGGIRGCMRPARKAPPKR